METMQGKKNIVLIGMPGAGKSTVGVVLAKRLGYRFLDSDLVIQEQTKKLLHGLITEHGVDGFLKIEEDINAGLDCEQAVIATGGSVIYGEKAMEHLRKIGCVVYLKLSYKEIEDRLGDLTARGVALKNGHLLQDRCIKCSCSDQFYKIMFKPATICIYDLFACKLSFCQSAHAITDNRKGSLSIRSLCNLDCKRVLIIFLFYTHICVICRSIFHTLLLIIIPISLSDKINETFITQRNLCIICQKYIFLSSYVLSIHKCTICGGIISDIADTILSLNDAVDPADI